MFTLPPTNLDWLHKRVLFLTRHGSMAYGTNIASSDEDFKGLCIPPLDYQYSFLLHFEQAEFHKPDIVIYDIKKFFKLAADCNPSIIEVLFTEPEDHVWVAPFLGESLLHHRNSFLSKKARFTFSGYATAQLKRIKTHKRWMDNPPKPGDGDYPKYLEWRNNRNPDRATLEEKFGYDTKHAMHLVRLMRMCKEILKTGEVIVKRPDKDELLAIRGGAWKYEDLLEWAEKQDQEMENLYQTSPLPHSPNMNHLDILCQNLIMDSMNTKKINWESKF